MNSFKWPAETALALASRLRFIIEALESIEAKKILDIGCGTGEHLTNYLAQACPGSEIYGIDSDNETISYAKKKFCYLSNLKFSTQIPEGIKFDAIIASEVIEHVENPCDFLLFLRSKLSWKGLLIITLPNGYGCSEIMSLFETLLSLCGVLSVARRLKHLLKGNPDRSDTIGADTKAVSPHINFFSFSCICVLFNQTGFYINKYQGRMFLHNFIASMVINQSAFLSKINAKLGQILPPWLVSDWMFVLRPQDNWKAKDSPLYQRNLYERIRRYLNLKRYGLYANKEKVNEGKE